jgi:hypothetical protein
LQIAAIASRKRIFSSVQLMGAKQSCGRRKRRDRRAFVSRRLARAAADRTQLGSVPHLPTGCARVWPAFGSLLVQRDQWDTSWGPKKIFFLIRDIDDATRAGASMESCRFVVLRSPRGRLGSVLYTCKRLRRLRGRFDQWIHISTGPLRSTALDHDPPKFWIQSSLESPKHRRMRSRGPPDPRPVPEGVRVTRTVNGTGHTGPSEFCATSI